MVPRRPFETDTTPTLVSMYFNSSSGDLNSHFPRVIAAFVGNVNLVFPAPLSILSSYFLLEPSGCVIGCPSSCFVWLRVLSRPRATICCRVNLPHLRKPCQLPSR